MTAPSRQFAYLQRQSLATINAEIADLPILASRVEAGGFRLTSVWGEVLIEGRYQLVLTFIAGYRAGLESGRRVG